MRAIHPSMVSLAMLFVDPCVLLLATPCFAQDAGPLENMLTKSEQQTLGISTMRPEQRETLRQALIRLYQSGYRTAQGRPSPAITIESQVDGEFNGWEGETIVKLLNGQIWQQTEYHYEYRYAYMPKVLVYPSGGGYKMKVDDTAAVGVQRLK